MSAIVKVALVFLFHMCECFLFLLFWIASGYFPVQAHGSLHKWSPRENATSEKTANLVGFESPRDNDKSEMSLT